MQHPMAMAENGGVRPTARAISKPTSTNVPVQPANLQELQQKPEFTWADTAFKEDDLSYKDNIKIYDFSDRCCRKLRISFTGTQMLQLWCVNDIAGMTAAGFTWALVIFGEIALIFGVLIHFYDPVYSTLNGILNFIMAFLGLVAHSRCMFMDPVSTVYDNCITHTISNFILCFK